MNTYERHGITKQLLAGKRIVVATSYSGVRRIFTAIADTLHDLAEVPDLVSGVNGAERIEINGGRLTLAQTPEDLPYTVADVLVVSAVIRNKPDFYEQWLFKNPPLPASVEVLST